MDTPVTQPPEAFIPQDQPTSRAQDQEQRRRRLREELLAFLEKLRPWCERFDTLDDWWRFLRPFDRWLESRKADLTPEQYRRLKRYVQWSEGGREALSLACKSLSRELAAIADELALAVASGGAGAATTAAATGSAGLSGWLWALIALTAVGGLVWGARQLWLTLRPATGVVVEIRSQGCAPVEPPTLDPEVREGFRLLGVNFPQEPLTEEQPWRFTLPAQIRTLRLLRTSTTLEVTVEVAGGVTWVWSVPWENDASQWLWEDQPIEMNTPLVIRLEPGKTVPILVQCTTP